jgi:heptaprenyl diphosphate synthase
MTQIATTREDLQIAWLTALAITIHLAESSLPTLIPGIKPGLANIITIVVLVRYGWSIAAWVVFLRVLAGSILLGTFLSPTFLLSLAGAICSIIILKPASLLPGKGFSPVGYSLLAAISHMAGQFTVAYLIFIPHQAMLYLLPVLMTLAVAFGISNGIISKVLLEKLPR